MEHYTINQSIKKKCKGCGQEFLAIRTSHKFHSKECSVAFYERTTKKRSEYLKRLRDDRQKTLGEELEHNTPDLLIGREAVADYLNIGVEEVNKRWTDIPFQHTSQIFKTGGGQLKKHEVVTISKKDLEMWCERVGYWQFKATTVKNYKEPLKVVPKGEGFGYLGAVTVTKDGNGVQCHICGKFYMQLSGHLIHAHKIKTSDYKEKFEIAYDTPLTCDNYREVLKLSMLEKIKQMTPEQKAEYLERAKLAHKEFREKMKHTLKLRLETKNKRGTCPDQLVDQIRKCAHKLGRTPTKPEFIAWAGTQRYIHKIYETFGSWTKAVEIAGFSVPDPTSQKGKKKGKISEDELLEYLYVFYETTGKSPTATDFVSHDLPNYQLYINKFGSISRARELAGVPEPDTSRNGQAYITKPTQIQKDRGWRGKQSITEGVL